VLSHKEPDKIVAARKGSAPLVIGHHRDGFFVTSDVPAISHHTRAIQILEIGELAVVSYGGVKISKFDGTPVQRPLTQAIWRSSDSDWMSEADAKQFPEPQPWSGNDNQMRVIAG
jgi:glucosamine 6-phosphate synthetase-like amidotransferase/phosphosugar isomerase protein